MKFFFDKTQAQSEIFSRHCLELQFITCSSTKSPITTQVRTHKGMAIAWITGPGGVRLLLLALSTSFCALVGAGRPASVNIGAVFAFDSVIGRAAKVAIEAAVADVNNDSSILRGTRLNLIMKDTNCSVFLGSVAGKNQYRLHLRSNCVFLPLQISLEYLE